MLEQPAIASTRAAIDSGAMIEILWLEMKANPFDPWVRAKDGKIKAPNAPGLGVNPDPAILARYLKRAVARTA